MKEKLTKEYFRRLKKIHDSSLNAGSTILAINVRAVSIIRYGAGIINWTQEELKCIDKKSRRMLTMYRSMHPRADIDSLYWKKADVGKGLASVEEVVQTEKDSLG